MNKLFLLFFISLPYFDGFASTNNSLSALAKSSCFGIRTYGSKGEWDKCVKAAQLFSTQSTRNLEIKSQCLDVRGHQAERLSSGCFKAAFIIKTEITIKPDLRSQKKFIGRCEESGWLNGDYGKNECRTGKSPIAQAAKQCASELAYQECIESGFKNCSSEPNVSYQYYFYNEPHCVATAKILVK